MAEFMYTGNQIEIDPKATTLYVISLLNDYDMKASKGIQTNYNPYNDTIHMTLENEKKIEVPKDIQINAINKWNLMNEEKQHNQNENDVDLESNTSNMSMSVVHMILFVIVIVFALYLLNLVQTCDKKV